MKSEGSDWYKKIWSLDIKNQSWTENTAKEVDFIIDKLSLKEGERILDLACGYGRHSLELARRGFEVVGVDITKDYVDDANASAKTEGLPASFILSDLREVSFMAEFDAVLNLADGAIGYLENDAENLKIFDVIARALKSGGRSFIDIMSGDYADAHFPQKLWDNGENGVTLSLFEWDKATRIMMYGQQDFAYGEPLEKREFGGCPTRLYTKAEIAEIMRERGLTLENAFCNYDGAPASSDGIQLMALSKKK
ncbi:MAG: class I SAM-dependent methyltransferase [Ruminococcaceae bacterium]|nr:class I SAM-dependent methyltransferase [Oscillospiraceae bacterium]